MAPRQRNSSHIVIDDQFLTRFRPCADFPLCTRRAFVKRCLVCSGRAAGRDIYQVNKTCHFSLSQDRFLDETYPGELKMHFLKISWGERSIPSEPPRGTRLRRSYFIPQIQYLELKRKKGLATPPELST